MREERRQERFHLHLSRIGFGSNVKNDQRPARIVNATIHRWIARSSTVAVCPTRTTNDKRFECAVRAAWMASLSVLPRKNSPESGSTATKSFRLLDFSRH
jgi:hypothetical protein